MTSTPLARSGSCQLLVATQLEVASRPIEFGASISEMLVATHRELALRSDHERARMRAAATCSSLAPFRFARSK